MRRKMCNFDVKFLVIFIILVQQVFTQTTTIYFDISTTTAASPQPGCRCVPAGTCVVSPGIDIRIVNSGAQNCAAGQVWCCGNSGGFTSSCGRRKVTNASPQPTGTARYGAYPWQVALLTLDNMYIGSGVLINANFVLTVAHKVQPYAPANFKLRLGDWDGKATVEPNPYVEFRPLSIGIHPNFKADTLQNDVAVIRLNGMAPIATAPNINTACLPTAMIATGTRCWVSGWGKNSFGSDGRYQALLKEVDVPIVDQGSCETRLRTTRLGSYFVLDTTSFICAGGEAGKDACTGDGGAPLVCQTATQQFQVIGLVAWGIGCASSGIPGVYVNVNNYVAWINQQMASMG
ncbi:phenoloxidase-activating factor 2 [Diachasma alloeum]|uniref:phenoloxidase-activating factor 2 n=1 Tax=Diachasma alloeum TaxID=454923 RepID=UPI0007382603|nr:phenoloxidase-activating factor 2 [Diachasma alloeum]